MRLIFWLCVNSTSAALAYEDDVNGLCWVIDHCFNGGGIVVKFLGSDAAIIVVKVIEDGWDKRHELSCIGVAKGGEIFGANDFNLLDEGSLKKKSL